MEEILKVMCQDYGLEYISHTIDDSGKIEAYSGKAGVIGILRVSTHDVYLYELQMKLRNDGRN